MYDLKVSILMSCYNGERWLAESINSILSQTYKDFEFIIIDDGSLDRTWEIIQRFSILDKRIVSVHKENTGLSDSLNYGIKIAKGKWIARIDQDDVCFRDRIKNQMSYVEQNPKLYLVGGFFEEVDHDLNFIKFHSYPTAHKKLIENLVSFKKFFPHSSAFYRTDIAREIGGYNKRFAMADDRRLWLDFAQLGIVGCVPRMVVKIRKHQSQMSRLMSGNTQTRDALAATVCYLIKKNGAEDPGLFHNENKWTVFINWVNENLNEKQIYDKEKNWLLFRANVLEIKVFILWKLIKVINSVLIDKSLIYSAFQKKFGSNLPKELMYKWIKKNAG